MRSIPTSTDICREIVRCVIINFVKHIEMKPKVLLTTLLEASALMGCGVTNELTSTKESQLCVSVGDGGNGCCPGSPIIVDLLGDGIHLTGPEDGVLWTLRRDQPGRWAWTLPGSDDAWLALDRNGNRGIDDGSELFGDGSTQVDSNDPNGFAALAYYDLESQGGNGDGVIDARDSVWSQLRLWQDRDHDAFSASYELMTLDEAGVHSFSLAATRSMHRDEHGNEFRYHGTIVADAPVSSVVSDVWLQQAPIPIPFRAFDTYLLYTCWAWAYSVDFQNGGACNVPTVRNDPTVSLNGRPTRLVARSITSAISPDDAIDGSLRAYRTATQSANGDACIQVDYPSLDLYRPAPYDVFGDVFNVRVKCYISVGGGGGGGGGGC